MPDAKKLNEQKRSEKQPAGEEDYNPVNMAGKKTEKSDEPSQEVFAGTNKRSARFLDADDHVSSFCHSAVMTPANARTSSGGGILCVLQ